MKTRNQELVRFDPSIVTVKQSSIVSQIVSSPFVLLLLVLLDLVNKSFVTSKLGGILIRDLCGLNWAFLIIYSHFC